jgi:hypothetical protein
LLLCPSFHRDVSPFEKHLNASKVVVWLNNDGPQGKPKQIQGAIAVATETYNVRD